MTVPVTPVDDLIYEGSETVTLSLPPNSGYNLYYNTATISLTDNEQLVSIVATDPTAAETKMMQARPMAAKCRLRMGGILSHR